ncbi:hypothetical protein HaLaN_24233 [Haematococcus lacustris]|uniref:Uncharacterized protein n=1 Tax=Haematococcus lacustris TaxID=44745 RepID=A0A6A0A2M1_HAELA|nr:hypothetical protein HaLaN_24233 [Haematococcus lacustris]
MHLARPCNAENQHRTRTNQNTGHAQCVNSLNGLARAAASAACVFSGVGEFDRLPVATQLLHRGVVAYENYQPSAWQYSPKCASGGSPRGETETSSGTYQAPLAPFPLNFSYF